MIMMMWMRVVNEARELRAGGVGVRLANEAGQARRVES